ncbi:MAG: phage tail sheath C-terminal domain-containing protein [Crocinitomicaceae bacterium]|nr:phage tail sheath C-terminal domain-containing protein [Crocinitomicaceae bacterium]
MAKQYKTPGVYITEVNSFGSSIVANETAIPVFLGLTEYANNPKGDSLNKVKGSSIVTEPVLVGSILEYENTFGGPDETGRIYVTASTDKDGKVYSAQNKNQDGTEDYEPGLMHPSVFNFFSNGGGSCYIVSLGKYEDFKNEMASTITTEMNFIEEAIKMAETATLILPTDLIRFGGSNYYNWGTQLTNFSEQEKKYFTVLDVIQEEPNNPVFKTNDIDAYRDSVTPDFPSYAGAYFPYLKSRTPYAFKGDLSNVYLDEKLLADSDSATIESVKTFLATNYINMPPSPFMAGIYSRLDNASGVWTPPANVSPIDVSGPLVPLTNKEQEGLNVDATSGKSINAIRSFTGQGTLVWGARTNDGNSMDWRYVNVRRLFIAMETDISMALEAFVFKPNVHNTWVEVKTMIESYLLGLFNDGAFAGTTPETSYQVMVGKGETMTDEDILNGYMRVSIQVAPVRPAEFIVLTFTQMVGDH